MSLNAAHLVNKAHFDSDAHLQVPCVCQPNNQFILHIPYQMGAVYLQKVSWSTLE